LGSFIKEALKNEFGEKLTAKHVHKMIENRKKNQKESLIEYFYSMTALANQSKLGEESIIEYIVEGIPDSKQNKSCLYQASNLKEFREKLKVYEKICASQGFKPRPKFDSS